MNDVESNNDSIDLVGKRVRILGGFGAGGEGVIVQMNSHHSTHVDLYVDNDPMGATYLRGNYSPGSWEVIEAEAETNGDAPLNVEAMVPPRGTVIINSYSGQPYLVDARHRDDLLVYRLRDEEGIWKFVDGTSPSTLTVEEVAGMAWMNPQPAGHLLVAMAMEVAERHRRDAATNRDRWTTVTNEHNTFVHEVSEALHKYADHTPCCGTRLCEEFDSWMEDHGLERRKSPEYEVEFTVTFTGRVTVKADTDTDARDLVENETEGDGEDWNGMDAWIRDRIGASYASDAVRITSVERR